MPSHDLNRLLDFDPRKAALESGTSKPSRLAAALATDHQARLEALLKEFNDTYLGQGFKEFQAAAREIGFKELQRSQFYSNGQAFFSAMERDGMLLCANSYQGMVNQAQLLLRSREPLPGGERHGKLWRAAIDVRQGLQFRVQAISSPLPAVLQVDLPLMSSGLTAHICTDRWPRRARRKMGVK